MVLAKSREKGMSIRFFHMLHFILPCLVMSNIYYMRTLDKVSTSSNFSSVLQGYDRTCYVIPWGRMDVPWPHHCAPEGDRFNSALQHLQRPPMVRAFTLVILCSILLALRPAYETLTVPFSGIAGIACWIRQYFWLLLWGYAHALINFSLVWK